MYRSDFDEICLFVRSKPWLSSTFRDKKLMIKHLLPHSQNNLEGVVWNLTCHEILRDIKAYVASKLTWLEILRNIRPYVTYIRVICTFCNFVFILRDVKFLRDVKSYVTWNITWHEFVLDLNFYVTLIITWHKGLRDINSWNRSWCEILRDMKSYMTWNLTWHEILLDKNFYVTWNLKWQRIFKTFGHLQTHCPGIDIAICEPTFLVSKSTFSSHRPATYP